MTILTIDSGPDAAGAESKEELGPDAAGAISDLLRFSSETFERGRAAAPLGVPGRSLKFQRLQAD
jgi:hypothetical protein